MKYLISTYIVFFVFPCAYSSSLKNNLAPESWLQLSYNQIVVFDEINNVPRLLNIIKGTMINRYPARIQAARSLNRWLKHGVIHVKTIKYIVRLLEDNEKQILNNIYFAISDKNEIEGFVHLFLDDAFIMEIAPWNRGDVLVNRKHKGVGAELRFVFLNIIKEEQGNAFYSEKNIKKIKVLGNRREEEDLFDMATINRKIIQQYMQEHEIKRSINFQVYLSS